MKQDRRCFMEHHELKPRFIGAAYVESAEGIGLISDKTDWGRRLEGVVVHPW